MENPIPEEDLSHSPFALILLLRKVISDTTYSTR